MSPSRTAVLDRAFRPVLSRRSGVAIALSGAAGAGKSHEAAEFMRALPCRSVSLQAGATVPEVVTALAEVRPQTPAAAGPLDRLAVLGPGWDMKATTTLSEVLTALAPFALHLDDPRVADQTVFSHVCRLAETVKRRSGVGLLVTTRGQLGTPFDHVRLDPLGREEVASLIEDRLSTAPPAATLDWIHGRAAGNPLFTLEYLRHVRSQGLLWSDGRRWHWRAPSRDAVPSTVYAILAGALEDSLAEETDRRVLEALAALSPDVDAEQWLKIAAVTPEEMRDALSRLNGSGALYRNAFAHPLYEHYVLSGLTGTRRRDLSRRAVEALACDPARAAPFIEAAELPASTALAILEAAAERSLDARSRGRHLAKAARMTAGEERGRLALEAASSLRQLDYPAAGRLAQIAVNELPRSVEAAELLAELMALQGRAAAAESAVERLPAPRRDRCLIHVRALAGDHEGVLKIWEGALASAQAKAGPPGSVATRQVGAAEHLSDARIKADVAIALMERGALEEAADLVLDAIERTTGEERLALNGVLARARHLQGRFTEAMDLLTCAIEEQRAAGPIPALAANLQTRCEVRQSLGDMRGKREDIEEAVAIYESLGDRRGVAAAKTKLGVLLIEEGDHVQAEAVLQESREELEALGSLAQLVECERMLCYLYRQRSLPLGSTLARHYATAALRRARDLENTQLLANTLYEASYSESLNGEPERGLALAEEGLELCADKGLPQTGIYALFSRAFAHERLGETAIAANDYLAAAEGADRLALAMDAQTIRLELDRLAGDEASARSRQAWFEANGLSRRAQMVDEYFPNTSAGPAEQAPPATPDRLEVLGPVRYRTSAGVRQVRGRKRLQLLVMLLEARVTGRGEVTRQALWHAIYPDRDTTRADSCLKELVHGLRTWAGTGVITTTLAGYALGDCESDVESFLLTLDTRLWRGQFAANAEPGDGPIRETLYQALGSAAELLLTTEPREAARVGRLLVEADPYDSAALRTYLMALRRISNHRTLRRHYNQARSTLVEVGEQLPPRWQDFLAA